MKSMFGRLNRHRKVIFPSPSLPALEKTGEGAFSEWGKKALRHKVSAEPLRVNSFFSSRDGLGCLSVRRMTEAQKNFFFQEFQSSPVGVSGVFIGKRSNVALQKLVSERCLNLSNAFVILSLT